MPSYYDRHASVHGVGDEQYNDGAAVAAVMLMASLMREAPTSSW